MKIFISHSSRDKWIARKLSEEISNLGFITFLDEKDIETGQSIDEEIAAHLNESDEFLLLLSPDSIKSHWVLLELGGALALKKKIVIIMLYLGANDIPQPISKYLARDINEIEKYYIELKQRMQGKFISKPIQEVIQVAKSSDEVKFNIGEYVQLPLKKPNKIRIEIGWLDDAMDSYLGQKVEITNVDYSDRAVQIKQDAGEYWWAFEWLIKVEK